MNRTDIKTRRGVSLTELLVLMSACSMILTTSAALLHRAMRTQSQARSFYDVERSSARLARQFRDDVHQASSATTAGAELDENVLARLQRADGRTVEYRHDGTTVLRVLSRSEGNASREEFAFLRSIDVAVSEEGGRVMLTIVGGEDESLAEDKRRLLATTAMPVSLHVEATLNRDLPFVSTPDQEPTQ